MADQYDGTGFDSSLYLNPNEQDLLLTALNSNKPNANMNKQAAGIASQQTKSSESNITQTSPSDADNVSNGLPLDNRPFVDYELDESQFDWDISGQMFGSLSGDAANSNDGNSSPEAEGDVSEKRKMPEDENEEDGGGKRREGEDKNNKKPGRKPLTSEPTTKRKAQNRAAQRAFRERKEKHLKDLETKVEELEKASESTTHENGLLRAQVERLQAEVKEYRKRLSVTNNSNRTSPRTSQFSLSAKSDWEFNNNFQFAFPKFGPLGTDPNTDLYKPNQRTNSATASPTSNGRALSNPQPSYNGADALSDLFSPSVLASAVSRSGSADLFPSPSPSASQNGRGHSSEINTLSPCSSVTHSVSQHGFSSSCATTPESGADSPDLRKNSESVLNINEDSHQRRVSAGQEAFCKEFSTACGNTKNPVPQMLSESNKSPASASSTSHQPNTPGVETATFDWFANQSNGGIFDPVLFGDYREPQDNILNGDFGFFDNAFSSVPELNSPIQPLEPALPKKKDLMKQIEDTQAGKETEVVPGENPKQFLTCNMLWDRVQRSQKVQSGEADMDELCSQLKAKAKCSGNGAVIEQRDVDAILGPAPDDTKDFFKMFK